LITPPRFEPITRMKKGVSGKESVRFGPCYSGEGERVNLTLANPFQKTNCKVEGAERITLRHTPPTGIPSSVDAFEISDSSPFVISLHYPTIQARMGYTFSFYACSDSKEKQYIEVSLSDGTETEAITCELAQTERRYSVSKEFHSSPVELWVTFKDSKKFPSKEPFKLIVEFLVLEDGLFQSSYFASYDDLPGKRPLDRHSIPCDNLSEEQGAIVVFFRPEWFGHELGWHENACIFDWSANAGVTVLADGSDFGRFKLVLRTEDGVEVIDSQQIPVSDEIYCLCVRWADGVVEFCLNSKSIVPSESSHRVSEMPAPNDLGNELYLLNAREGDHLSGFGYLHPAYRTDDNSIRLENFVLLSTRWLSDGDIRAHMYSMYAANYPEYRFDWLRSTSGNDARMFKASNWCTSITHFLLKLEDVWQQNPPGWLREESVLEAECRDEVHRTMLSMEWSSSIEFQGANGVRTDLYLEDGQQNERIRIEFKVWGRSGYKDIPEQPIKYFASNESFGVVVMINENISSIGNKYRMNVVNSATNCVGLCELPFEANFFSDHFVSHHRTMKDLEVEILHIVIDKTPQTKALLRS
jgi:hypothetical protein